MLAMVAEVGGFGSLRFCVHGLREGVRLRWRFELSSNQISERPIHGYEMMSTRKFSIQALTSSLVGYFPFFFFFWLFRQIRCFHGCS